MERTEATQMQHFGFLQEKISRMNANSFQVKGLMITIVSAFVAVYASTKNILFILIPLFPTVLFWFLDAYYLQQERKFRGVYDDAVAGTKELTGEVKVDLYTMPIEKYRKGEFLFWRSFFSLTMVAFYFSVCVLLMVSFFVLTQKTKILNVIEGDAGVFLFVPETTDAVCAKDDAGIYPDYEICLEDTGGLYGSRRQDTGSFFSGTGILPDSSKLHERIESVYDVGIINARLFPHFSNS